MHEINAALEMIAREVQQFPEVDQILTADAIGRVLAYDAVCEVDSPPFDKAMMDGFACRANDLSGDGMETLSIIGEIAAGHPFEGTVGSGQVAQIMTGAPIPDGADCVVPIEQAMVNPESGTAHLSMQNPQVGKHIMKRGESMQAGTTVLSRGHRVRAHDVGVLAELGLGEVTVVRKPVVSILATGDELVTPGAPLGPGQIRNSNEPLLAAMATAVGTEVKPLGIARDNEDDLREKIAEGLNSSDVLVLSGGVSAGTYDLVPLVLRELGVEQVFHKVNIKPGKPLWFGVKHGDSAERCLVFGLPGNPVSTLVTFEVFVEPVLRALSGELAAGLFDSSLPTAVLTHPIGNKSPRPTYFPAKLDWSVAGGLTVTTVDWKGSGDLLRTSEANCSVFVDAETDYAAGDMIGVLRWSGAFK
ncbi:molybdopterin molybdotransferase MoeA [Calycomorphotria hydatis]|uniref:Molybdopterin molybdenumtransferase n=1 Tax=Calycomorphotria hydatis TaxID=2528027 RepID=A0A517T7L6_9PLAN|nr:gephyrin-like molybdotransferase Glp [Calycomorphotria hydatis]QDT64367.1 Molybdopterin molybdenumtransferase [Calycomorphotria hydatis]